MSLASDIGVLRRVPMLSEFSEDQLRLLAFSAESSTVREGTRIFRQGEIADGGVVITKGRVQLETGTGDHIVNHGVYGEGTLLGENALLSDGIRPVTARALEDCSIIRIRRPLFSRMLQEYPELAGRLLKVRADKFKRTTDALERIGRRLSDIDRLSASIHKKEGGLED
ncbi:cyclic nucleotide-binding domain-containing protein [Rhodobacteraceae bacterium RKSG542]|uniref:cyclic nucleotide-binding domain-containing protein n=1 Tax=Pseudovibrio flavus TaxID=2529854 RepID=UPI0012BD5710|nr:cyclic nucleotide-binding domain-containing protein [Pseudovibrio flavus]MTI17869.1 cyclic nucleotide-binding domain-containing protein [Pseudovibrio flavus]